MFLSRVKIQKLALSVLTIRLGKVYKKDLSGESKEDCTESVLPSGIIRVRSSFLNNHDSNKVFHNTENMEEITITNVKLAHVFESR